uniref:Putative kynurenine formamidase n=1 Tax=Lutzomyia longipalpis TaxID=7200 RepID=A0A7G3AHR6_LUTLO
MENVKDLEKEFSPSAWSRRFEKDQELLDNHKKVVKDGTTQARELLKCELDVPYGPGRRSKLDIYGTDQPSDAPIFVIFHGGYWQLEEYTKEVGSYGTLPLVHAGCRVIAADYEMCPEVTLTELVELTHKCFTYILNYAAQIGASSVNFLGHSAGAHLIIAQFQEAQFSRLPHQHLIQDVYLLSGVYDIRELRHTKAANNGNILSITDDNVVTLSPALADYGHLAGTSAHFTVVVTENESQSYKKISQDMKDALAKGTENVKLILLPNRDHFDIVEQLNDKDAELTKNPH